MGSIHGVFIITYRGKVVLLPIPVVAHVDCINLYACGAVAGGGGGLGGGGR